ncbi:MAG: hypothetical protein U9Q83_09545 [Bacteroidota bacterium]|nr:hypothetical protein [Bacteroidota bacterium]
MEYKAHEVKLELQKRNIPISVSEVEYLSKKFIIYLSAVQEENNTGIVEMMNANGGYILHIDALGGTKGGQRLISGVDGVSDFVLGNAKIKTENSLDVGCFLNNIKDDFSDPLAVVQDMGRGIMKAVKDVFPNIPIFICHFHFLRDIGKDLLEENYDIIRKRLRHFAFLSKLRNWSKELKFIFENRLEAVNEFCNLGDVNASEPEKNDQMQAVYLYSLIEWILDWKTESNGYGFPFDRPHLDLTLRVEKVGKIIDIDKYIAKQDSAVYRIGLKFQATIEAINKDIELREKVIEITNEIQFFDKLRDAMRIAKKNETAGLNDDGKDEEIKTIEKDVDEFMSEIKENPPAIKNSKLRAFIKQLNKYRKQLFADPIKVNTDDAIKEIQPQRTNNLMERMFRDFTRDNKRKTGIDSIGNTIQGMVADTPLIRNLGNSHYREIIMGSKTNLADVFDSIDVSKIKRKMNEHAIRNDKILNKIKALLKGDKLFSILSNSDGER